MFLLHHAVKAYQRRMNMRISTACSRCCNANGFRKLLRLIGTVLFVIILVIIVRIHRAPYGARGSVGL
jgi:hypothetical protein